MPRPSNVLRCIACLTIFVALAACASTAEQKSPGEYVDDAALTAKVKTAIFQEPTLKSLQIDVTTYRGVVQLGGFVDNPDMIAKAGEVASKVPGVKEVKNNLQVKPAPVK